MDRRRLVLEMAGLAAIPVVLVAVEAALPSASVEVTYQFRYSDPTLVAAWTSHYLHLSPAHLRGNLIQYAIVAIPAWVLALARARRFEFWMALASFLILGPLLITSSTYAMVHLTAQIGSPAGVSAGFSGILFAITGYLLWLTWHSLPTVYGWRGRWYRLGLCCFLVGELILATALQAGDVPPLLLGGALIGTVVGGAGILLAVGAILKGRTGGPSELISLARTTPRRHGIYIAATLVLIVTMLGLVQVEIYQIRNQIVTGPLVTTYTHAFGLLLGLIFTPTRKAIEDRVIRFGAAAG